MIINSTPKRGNFMTINNNKMRGVITLTELTKKKILGIILLVLIGVAYFQASTCVVKSFAYPSDYNGAISTPIIPSNQLAKH
jgi:hypothetical protein